MRIIHRLCCPASPAYVQGAYVGKTREYFYYVSHEGRLFLDDTKHKNFTSSYKDVAFLNFFYRMLRKNRTESWHDFPWMSRCGIERNFLRCDDRPIVLTKLLKKDSDQPSLVVGESALEMPFEPSKLEVGANGRLYHPVTGTVHMDLGRALLTSKLADELFPLCRFDASGRAKALLWREREYPMVQL